MNTDRLQLWLASKNHKQDLPFLKLIKSEMHFSILDHAVKKFELLRPSYSDGLKILELITENMLISTDQNLENLFLNSDSVILWLNKLTELRYPITSKRDSDVENKMLNFPWPCGSKVKFERRGDRAGIELKLFITSSSDLIKAIASLERVQQELTN